MTSNVTLGIMRLPGTIGVICEGKKEGEKNGVGGNNL